MSLLPPVSEHMKSLQQNASSWHAAEPCSKGQPTFMPGGRKTWLCVPMKKPDGGDHLLSSLCSEKPLTKFFPFSSREVPVLFVKGSVLACAVYKYLSTVSLSTVYTSWPCSPKVVLALCQTLSVHSVSIFFFLSQLPFVFLHCPEIFDFSLHH